MRYPERACKPNICECQNGSPKTGHYCKRHGQTDCASCDLGFHQQIYDHGYYQENSCIPNKCECQNGYPNMGANCETHGEENCRSCRLGYELESKTCIPVPFPVNKFWMFEPRSAPRNYIYEYSSEFKVCRTRKMGRNRRYSRNRTRTGKRMRKRNITMNRYRTKTKTKTKSPKICDGQTPSRFQIEYQNKNLGVSVNSEVIIKWFEISERKRTNETISISSEVINKSRHHKLDCNNDFRSHYGRENKYKGRYALLVPSGLSSQPKREKSGQLFQVEKVNQSQGYGSSFIKVFVRDVKGNKCYFGMDEYRGRWYLVLKPNRETIWEISDF